MLDGKPSLDLQQVRKSESLPDLLLRHGFHESGIRQVLRSPEGPASLTLRSGDRYAIEAGESEFALRLFDPYKDRSFRIWRKGKTSGFTTKVEAFETKEVQRSGHLNGSLLEALQAKIPDVRVAYRFLDAFILDTDFDRLQKGAAFTLKVQEKYIGNQFIRYGEILEAALETDQGLVRRSLISFAEGGAFVDAENRRRPLYAPVNYLRISSVYQPRRFHPIRRRHIAHLGVDFELPEGEPVLAAQSGRILRTGKNKAAGRFVVIQHAGGLESYYNHLSRISPRVRAGSRVHAGQIIGAIGCTGYCTKAHLHFAVKRRGQMVNPAGLMHTFPYTQAKLAARESSRLRGLQARNP